MHRLNEATFWGFSIKTETGTECAGFFLPCVMFTTILARDLLKPFSSAHSVTGERARRGDPNDAA